MLRAGPLSDERVVRLANRRFVAVYFDLSDAGAAGDPEARRFVVAARPELGGRSVPTPPILFMTPDGKVLGEVSNYAPTERVLAAMLRVLREHPAYNRPGPEERRLKDPVARARVLLDLLAYGRARRLLAGARTQEAGYLLGHVARWQRDWPAMEEAFRGVTRPDLLDAVRVERAYRLWYGRDYRALRAALADFPRASNRYAEARYLEGLALYHLGERAAARRLWADLVRRAPEGPWVYRADWAYFATGKDAAAAVFSSLRRRSLLGRIGYLGRFPPDLQGPPPPWSPPPGGAAVRRRRV